MGKENFREDGVLCGVLLVSGDLGPDANSLQDFVKVTYHFWAYEMKSGPKPYLQCLL